MESTRPPEKVIDAVPVVRDHIRIVHLRRDEPYTSERKVREAKMSGRRAAAREKRPWEYAKQPRVAVNKSTADFNDGDARRYRILWDESCDDITQIPVYCKSGAKTQRRFPEIYRVGDRITLFYLGTYQFRATLRNIGYSKPRAHSQGTYSGRLILDLRNLGVSLQQLRDHSPAS